MSEYPETTVKQLELKALLICKEHLERCGGACNISVRTLARTLAKRIPEVQSSSKLLHFADKFLENQKWATLWGLGFRSSWYGDTPSRRIYALVEPEEFELPNMTVGSTHTSRLARGKC